MSVKTRHPLYLEKLEDWEVMRDTYEGERIVKEKGTKYLPPTGGMVADGMDQGKPGYEAYQAYRCRAVFHDFVRTGIEGMLGMMHREPARIELPEALEGMRDNATSKGESLQMLLRKMNEHQLRYGRYGLLLEAPDGVEVGDALPYIATYEALTIINWDDGRREQGRQRLEFVVLDETEDERDANFQWSREDKYRVLIMSDQAVTEDEENQEAPAGGVYQVAVLREGATDLNEAELIEPSIGGRTLEEIPFVFVNTKDVVTSPDEGPLLSLTNLSLAIYRLEADSLSRPRHVFRVGVDRTTDSLEAMQIPARSRCNLAADAASRLARVKKPALDGVKGTTGNSSLLVGEGPLSSVRVSVAAQPLV